jgi:hypothetical protein
VLCKYKGYIDIGRLPIVNIVIPKGLPLKSSKQNNLWA